MQWSNLATAGQMAGRDDALPWRRCWCSLRLDLVRHHCSPRSRDSLECTHLRQRRLRIRRESLGPGCGCMRFRSRWTITTRRPDRPPSHGCSGRRFGPPPLAGRSRGSSANWDPPSINPFFEVRSTGSRFSPSKLVSRPLSRSGDS